MTSYKSNKKFKDKVEKEFLRNSKITTGSKKSSTCNHKFVIPSILGSISKFQEKVSFPDNPNEVSLHRTRIYEKTVYRTSDIDKGSHKSLPGKKVESKNLLHKCQLIAEIEKQLRHLQSQKKYLQMTKETEQNQSWRESLSANQSIKTKKHLSKQGCTEKLPNGCDTDTRQVCALLQVLIEKNCVKVTDSSTQIETPLEHKKINGEDYSPSYVMQKDLSSDNSSVNVLWKGRANSRTLKRTSVKMVNSSTQVRGPVGDSKHRSTQVSIKKAGSRNQDYNPIRVSKQRLARKQHLVSSESSKSSPTFRRPEYEAKKMQHNPTNQREDYIHEQSKSYQKSFEKKLVDVEKKRKTRNGNINTKESSKSVAVLKSKEKRLSLTLRTAGTTLRSSYVDLHSAEKGLKRSEVLLEELVANPRKTVQSDNRKSSTKSHARAKTAHQIQQSPRREYITTSEYRDVQASFKTKSHQMTPLVNFHSPIRKQISRQTSTIRAQRTNIEQSRQNHSQSLRPVSKIIVSSTRKTLQTRKASQKAYIKSPTQSYKDSKQGHRVKNPNDLSREPSATPHWNSVSIRPNVIDDMTYIIPDTDKSEHYIVLHYVHRPNDVESPRGIKAKGTTNSLDNLSKNVIEKSSVILEDASTRESYANTSITPRVLLNGMQYVSNKLESTQINVSIPPASDQFNQPTRIHYNKMGSKSTEHEGTKSSNSDVSVRNPSSDLGNVSNKLELESASISTLPQQVSDMSKQSSQKNSLIRWHSSGLNDESIGSEVSNDPRTNTPTTSNSNRSNTEHISDLTDISIANQSDQFEIRAMAQPKSQMSNKMTAKNLFKSPRKENALKSELKDMSHQSKLSHDHKNNPSNWKSSIDSYPSKHEDISSESDFIHELQKIDPTSDKNENKDDLLETNTDIFKTVQNKEHLSKSKADGIEGEHTDIIRQTEPKVFKLDVSSSTVNNKSEGSSKSDLELKSPPSLSKSVTSANQSPEITCSDRSFTLKPIVQTKMHADVDHGIPNRSEHCTPKSVDQKPESHRGSNKLKPEDRVFGDSKIDEAHDVRKSSKMLAQTLVDPLTNNVKAETNEEHESISETDVVTKIPSELLNYIQYLQNRLKDCDEMVEKQTHSQRQTFQSNDGCKVENPQNCERGSIEKEKCSLSSLIKRERSTEEEEGEEAEGLLLISDREELDASLDSVSKYEISCCCSCCDEEQSTSYHSDIPPFTGCDCMKEGYYQIMRLAYGK